MEGDFGMNDLIIKAMELLSQELNELREDVHALKEQQHVNKITKNSDPLPPEWKVKIGGKKKGK